MWQPVSPSWSFNPRGENPARRLLHENSGRPPLAAVLHRERVEDEVTAGHACHYGSAGH